MPKVNVQRPNGPPAAPPSKDDLVLDRVRPLAAQVKPLTVSVYGKPRTGKTRFACSFPKPLLLVGTEDGTASVTGIPGIEFVRLKTCDELPDLIRAAQHGRWKTVALDNATKLREMRIVELFASMGMDVPEKKPFLYADKVWKGVWTQTSQDLRRFLGSLTDLPNVTDANVVVIAQEQDYNYETDGAAPLVRAPIGSALGKTVCDWLSAECDYVCQLFAREQEVVKKSGVGDETYREKTGRMEIVMRLITDGIHYAGFRLPEGRTCPEFLVLGVVGQSAPANSGYGQIMEIVTGKRPAPPASAKK